MGEALPQMNYQQSQELASYIMGIRMYAREIDMNYLKVAYESMQKQASFQDSAAILNRRNNPDKNESLHLSAKALYLLHEYIMTLKQIDDAKLKAVQRDEMVDEIGKLFL